MVSLSRLCGPLAALLFAGAAIAQAPPPASAPPVGPPAPPVNDRPDPYRAILSWQRLPAGRAMGAAAGIEIDRDGRSVWVADRCGANSCAGSNLPMVMKLGPDGRLLKAFGAGQLVTPHGLYVDRDGNIWVADMGLDAAGKRGAVAIKFSPEGKVLMTLGTPGVAGVSETTFTQPTDVVVAPNGDIFVADGHNGQDADPPPGMPGRVSKFSRDGRFIKSWGTKGTDPGQFRDPHGLAMDAAGRLFVADRGNNRIQIFDQDGKLLDTWRQFGRPSGIYIRGERIYVSDSESHSKNNPGGWKRGIRVGDVRTGRVLYFAPWLPEPNPDAFAGGMEGVAVDVAGNMYGSNTYLREFFPSAPWGEIRKFAPISPVVSRTSYARSAR